MFDTVSGTWSSGALLVPLLIVIGIVAAVWFFLWLNSKFLWSPRFLRNKNAERKTEFWFSIGIIAGLVFFCFVMPNIFLLGLLIVIGILAGAFWLQLTIGIVSGILILVTIINNGLSMLLLVMLGAIAVPWFFLWLVSEVLWSPKLFRRKRKDKSL